MAAKPYHVVVWGATGFTGRLVAEHLVRDYRGKGVKWALAGRSKERLEKLRLELSQTYGDDVQDIPILLGDLSDPSSLEAIARDTRCLISTAGPFVRLGTPIVEAALAGGSHYVDITGESSYVMNLIKRYHDDAAAKKLRIVPCCGYDSIPSDLGTYLVVDYMRKELNKAPAKVLTVVTGGKGGVSGGTIASGMEQEVESQKRGMPRDAGPYSFLPPGAPVGADRDFWGSEYEPTLKTWLGPFIMQVINTRVVHRTAALLGYGPAFHYQEATAAPNWVAAKALAWGTYATLAALQQRWLQPLLKKVLPEPGQGPSREAMMGGSYTHKVVGYTQEEGGAKPTVVVGVVQDKHRDPGYWGTSRMLLEAGLCLALQQTELDVSPDLPKGGVLTPASAMNGVLIERLRAAGITYKVQEVIPPAQ